MRHNVFVSYHHANDQYYRTQFEHIFAKQYDVFISKSVQIGEIDPYMKTDTIRQIIREKYLRDSTVTIVLIGIETWKRRHVDWEIGSSIRHTKFNPRSGLLGIFLPSYQLTGEKNNEFNQFTIPPRLYYNWKCEYAKLYKWTTDPTKITDWIEDAFINRNEKNPDNKFPSFVNNRNGERWYEQ